MACVHSGRSSEEVPCKQGRAVEQVRWLRFFLLALVQETRKTFITTHNGREDGVRAQDTGRKDWLVGKKKKLQRRLNKNKRARFAANAETMMTARKNRAVEKKKEKERHKLPGRSSATWTERKFERARKLEKSGTRAEGERGGQGRYKTRRGEKKTCGSGWMKSERIESGGEVRARERQQN